MTFKRIFSLDIKGQIIAVGFGRPGRGNHAIYDQAKKRITLERALLQDPEKLKTILRHEASHVVFTQMEEDFVESIEEAGSKADAALDTYFAEHPEATK